MSAEIQITRTDRGHVLRCEVELPAPLETVFAFFADAHQLESITPPWLHFSVVTPAPIQMRAGTLINYRLRLHGVPLGWQSLISLWDPPYRFVDEQIRGPYRFWHHLHTFESVGNTTRVVDEVEYAVPGGALVNALFVERDLRRIFAFRHARLLTLFGAGSPDLADRSLTTAT